MLSSPRSAHSAQRGRDYARGESRSGVRLGLGLTLAGALALAAGCEPTGGDKPLAAARTYEPVGRNIKWNASDADRFGVSARDFAGAGMGNDEQPASGGLQWLLPPGWSELPPRQFRDVNLRVAGDERAECYVSTLAGTGGGLESNINRWRSQMSLPALDAMAIAALPTLEWLGKPAVLVDFEGTWTGGMSEGQSGAGWRLVGLLIVDPVQSRFLKLIGPADVVARELEHFRALVASFGEGGGHGPGDGHDHSGDGMSPPPQPPAAASQQPQVPATPPSGAFAWTAPAGWTQGPAKAMREVTFNSGPGGAVECYVSLLSGDGGGLLANINRWCGQMGQPALSDAQAAALKREPVLGTEAAILELARGEGATAAPNQEYLIGALCVLSGRAVFVKMTGPRAAVEAQREPFLEFCRSLRTAK